MSRGPNHHDTPQCGSGTRTNERGKVVVQLTAFEFRGDLLAQVGPCPGSSSGFVTGGASVPMSVPTSVPTSVRDVASEILSFLRAFGRVHALIPHWREYALTNHGGSVNEVQGTQAGEGRLVWTVEEAGRLLGISRAHAYELVARGELPHVRLGRRVVVPKAATETILARAGSDT
jgi:excisionase family DNA binding protein